MIVKAEDFTVVCTNATGVVFVFCNYTYAFGVVHFENVHHEHLTTLSSSCEQQGRHLVSEPPEVIFQWINICLLVVEFRELSFDIYQH